jgi:predicted nucleic acid-binding protein
MVAGAIHLDTNILILVAEPAHPVREDLRRWSDAGARLSVSAMAWAEFRCGPVTPALLQAWEALLSGIVPVDRELAEFAAGLFNLSGRRARSLPDCLIAATAIRAGARLATLNPGDFEPLLDHGLALA